MRNSSGRADSRQTRPFNRIAALAAAEQLADGPPLQSGRWLFAAGRDRSYALIGPAGDRFFAVVLHGVGRSKVFLSICRGIAGTEVSGFLRRNGFRRVGPWNCERFERCDVQVFGFDFSTIADFVCEVSELHFRGWRRELEGAE